MRDVTQTPIVPTISTGLPGQPVGWRFAMTVCDALIVATFVAFAAYLSVRAGVLSLFV